MRDLSQKIIGCLITVQILYIIQGFRSQTVFFKVTHEQVQEGFTSYFGA